VESVPGRCSGAWVVKGSRILVEGILENAEEGVPRSLSPANFFYRHLGPNAMRFRSEHS
jgi:uncharacterized protein (DUF433 family)